MIKKGFIICVLIIVFMLPSCDTVDYSDIIKPGMTYDDIDALQDRFTILTWMKYAFLTDSNGNNIVAVFDTESLTVESVEVFSSRKASRHSFSRIKEGMSVLEVIEKVGNPIRSVTFGLLTLDFLASDGTIFRISWNSSDSDHLTVIEVYEVEQ